MSAVEPATGAASRTAPVLAAARRAAWQLVAGPDRPAAALAPPRPVRIGIWLGLAVLFGADFVQLSGGGVNDLFVVALLAVAHAGSVGLALRMPFLGWRLSFVTTAVTPLLVSTVSAPGPASTLVLHLCALFLLAMAAPLAVSALAAAVALLAGAAWALVAFVPAAIVGIAAAAVLVATRRRAPDVARHRHPARGGRARYGH